MNLPDKIIMAVESLPFREKSEILCAAIEYMSSGKKPESMSETAEAKFTELKPEIDSIMRRRARQAEYRRRRKEREIVNVDKAPARAATTKTSHTEKHVDDPEYTAPDYEPPRPMNRRERRLYERIQRKIHKRNSSNSLAAIRQ